MAVNAHFFNPNTIANAGEEIYKKLRADLEASHRGEFVAIGIDTKKFYLGANPEEALQTARAAEPNGVFHLIRVGFPGAFRISHAIQRTDSSRLFQ
jgi:hypothetical protein